MFIHPTWTMVHEKHGRMQVLPLAFDLIQLPSEHVCDIHDMYDQGWVLEDDEE